MECTCVTTCEADKPLWLEHLSNSYVIKTPDYFIILSHLCIYIIWSLAKLVAPSRNICLLRMCFYCTYNILCMNPIEGPKLRMNEWQGLLLLLTSEWPEASPTFPRGKWCIIMSNQAPRNIQLHVFNADQRRESGGFLRERELCQSDKLSIVVLKNCLAILHRLVLTIYALLKMFSFNFQCFSESIVPNV